MNLTSMTIEQIVGLITTGIGLFSVFVAVISTYTAREAAGYARQSIITEILLKLHEDYSSPEMNNAVRYLFKLRSDHETEFLENPYAFARDYIANTPTDSPQWANRRMVSHFYAHLANLVNQRFIDERNVFALWSAGDLAIIEILEPIETAILERYGSIPYMNEWPPLRLLDRARRWELRQHRRSKLNSHFTLPRDPTKYEYSKQNKKNSTPMSLATPEHDQDRTKTSTR